MHGTYYFFTDPQNIVWQSVVAEALNPWGTVETLTTETLWQRLRKDLPDSRMPDALLPGTLLPGTLLPGTLLPGALLPGALLPGALLPGALLPGALLPGALLLDASQCEDVIATIEELLQNFPALPVIVLTASPEWQLLRRVYQAGARDCVKMSLDPHLLRAELQTVLGPPQQEND